MHTKGWKEEGWRHILPKRHAYRWSDRWTDGHANRQQTCRRTEIFKHRGLNTKEWSAGWIHGQTDSSCACMHWPYTLVRMHTHSRINIEVWSKMLEVRNKDYHGHAYMHQTEKFEFKLTNRRQDGRMDGLSDGGPTTEKKTYKTIE